MSSVLMLMNEKTILTIVLKNKEIYFFVGHWNVEGYTEICVWSHDRRNQFWVQRG